MVVTAVRRVGTDRPTHLYKNAELGGVTLTRRSQSISTTGASREVCLCVCLCVCFFLSVLMLPPDVAAVKSVVGWMCTGVEFFFFAAAAAVKIVVVMVVVSTVCAYST